MWPCQMCPYHWFPTWQDHSPRCEQLLTDLWHHFRKSYTALTGGAGHGGQPDGRPVGSFSAVRLLSAMSAASALGTDCIFTLTCENIVNSEQRSWLSNSYTAPWKNIKRERMSLFSPYYFLISCSRCSLVVSYVRSSGDFTLSHPGDQVFTPPDSHVTLPQIDWHPPLHLSIAGGSVYTSSDVSCKLYHA